MILYYINVGLFQNYLKKTCAFNKHNSKDFLIYFFFFRIMNADTFFITGNCG